jgi:glycosyltransferase involved in cell wall biosynthesis
MSGVIGRGPTAAGGSIRSQAADSRPRVLQLALEAGSGYGGAEKLAYQLSKGIDSSRFVSYLCTIRAASRGQSDARDSRELRTAGVRALSLGQPGTVLMSPRAVARLYALLRRTPIDIVHAHMPRASVPGALLARLARVPVMISHEHGSSLEGKRLRRFLDREVVARLSTVMIAVSEWDRQNLISEERIAPDLIRVLPNGVAAIADGPRSSPAPEPASEMPVIGAVGRLYPEKGHVDLISAVALLRARGYVARCVIVGDGPQEAELSALVEGLGLRDQVTLLGWREDVGQVVQGLDVAVLCSVREGSPLAILEYMAAGAPIVATAVGGVPELIRDGVDGLLVAPGDPEMLCEAIARLIDDRGFAVRLGEAARSRRAAEFDLETLFRRVEELYEEMLASHGQGRRRG